MIDLNDIIIKKIKQLRLEKGLSQEKLSEQSGLDPKYINKLENGRFNLTLPTLTRILEGLNISYMSFFGSLETDEDTPIAQLFNALNSLNTKKRDAIAEILLQLIKEMTDGE
ncbi:helix-turn-helix domain-containing protein [Vagococcus acidifermentans]|uniref:HTH cro/C1-type domain-containing protein n=1 Tax=Vagococcus acidifermentans TaxID=564710 RepID=A0A430ATV6_9ENTE|nr:helix-turn-helix transcriptional regulator [Vagococcus acidifermentans]RSU11480.1 hypothetical protein CBF27_08270 [Vagococcus acidifermentans]